MLVGLALIPEKHNRTAFVPHSTSTSRHVTRLLKTIELANLYLASRWQMIGALESLNSWILFDGLGFRRSC